MIRPTEKAEFDAIVATLKARNADQASLKGVANGDTQTTLTELKFLKLDGIAIDVEMRGISISYEGTPATYVCMRDITAERQAETALRMSEVSLAEAQRVAQISVSST